MNSDSDRMIKTGVTSEPATTRNGSSNIGRKSERHEGHEQSLMTLTLPDCAEEGDNAPAVLAVCLSGCPSLLPSEPPQVLQSHP
jgi:hypothetical protein